MMAAVVVVPTKKNDAEQDVGVSKTLSRVKLRSRLNTSESLPTVHSECTVTQPVKSSDRRSNSGNGRSGGVFQKLLHYKPRSRLKSDEIVSFSDPNVTTSTEENGHHKSDQKDTDFDSDLKLDVMSKPFKSKKSSRNKEESKGNPGNMNSSREEDCIQVNVCAKPIHESVPEKGQKSLHPKESGKVRQAGSRCASPTAFSPTSRRRYLASERDGFCRPIDSYDGQMIHVDGDAAYEVGTFLGGGVAGVVYEGRRLLPMERYPNRSTPTSHSTRRRRQVITVSGPHTSEFERENSILQNDFHTKRVDHHGDEYTFQASQMCRSPMAYLCQPDLQDSSMENVDDLHLEVEHQSRRITKNTNEDSLQLVVAPKETNHRNKASQDDTNAVAIKILNPIGFRLLSPSSCNSAIVVKVGEPLDEDTKNGGSPMSEKHVWWLVNPNSRNLKDLMRTPSTTSSDKVDEEEVFHPSSYDRVTTENTCIDVDRGSPERGIRMSLIAAFLEPKTGLLYELPLPKCIEIWGHAPFGSSELEFIEMMDAIEKVNDGVAPKRSSVQTNVTQDLAKNKTGLYRAATASNVIIYCSPLDAHIVVPAVPPKYLRWLRQRRAITKEIRNMMRVGRHKNVIHLYEVLELIEDSKSIMFLVLELVRGVELFELISVNGKEGKSSGGNVSTDETGEAMMHKFFKELASGIAYCHSNGVAHRDLKPENLLVHTGPNGEAVLKIADFGLSAPFPQTQAFDVSSWTALCGSTDDVFFEPSTPKKTNYSSPTSPGPITGLSPLFSRHVSSLQALGATALSFLTCGNLDYVSECLPNQSDPNVDASNLKRMTSVVGSPHYVAPEIISRVNEKNKNGVDVSDDDGYDGTKADVWSAGVILYAMLFRSLPFGEDLLRCPRFQSFNKWYETTRKGRPRKSALSQSFHSSISNNELGPTWFFPSKGSSESKALIIAMLNPDPNDRLTIDEVLCHPWLKMKFDSSR